MASKDETSLLSGEALESQVSPQNNANMKGILKYQLVALVSVLGIFTTLVVLWWSHASVTRVNTTEPTKYEKTQMLGFSIYTFPENFVSDRPASSYAGSFDLRADVAGRIAIMTDAVKTAFSEANPDPAVLKVFIAPEFFFRGPQGAYDARTIYGCPDDGDDAEHEDDEADCFSVINEIGNQLEDLVKDPKYTDWLFIFGTVIAAQPDPNGPNEGRKLADITPLDSTLFWNFAPVYKGGDLLQKWLITKSYISGIDFLNRNNFSLNVDNPNPDPYREVRYTETPPEAKNWLDSRGYQVVEGNMSTISFDGLLVGIEICLDHSKHVLRDTTVGEQVDLQLITSAGMSIEEAAVVAPIVFLQDGGTASQTSFTSNASRGSGPWHTWTLSNAETGVLFTANQTVRDMFPTLFAVEDITLSQTMPKIITTPEFYFWWKLGEV